MLAIHAKRGVESTLERIFKNTGRQFDKLEFLWSGSTAGITFERINNSLRAKVIFPAINEISQVSRERFNNLIAYAVHELGHAWFTDNQPWDLARREHGGFVSNLINGLEDPRIERKVIESGYAPNSKALFEDLINAVLGKDGHVDADDIKNVPFLLAVEGRRLNGYVIDVPNIIDDAPWSSDLHWALAQAQRATNTQQIVDVALELYKRLQQTSDKPTEPTEPTDEDGEKQGGDGQPVDGDKPSDDGDDGQGDGKGDGDGDEPSDQEGDKPSDKPSDKPDDKPSKGRGKSDFAGGRDVEPTDFIEREMKDESFTVDDGRPRPSVGKPVYASFEWS
jgi:hypothetical protein